MGRLITSKELFNEGYIEPAIIQIESQNVDRLLDNRFIIDIVQGNWEPEYHCHRAYFSPLDISRCYYGSFFSKQISPKSRKPEDYNERLKLAKLIGLAEVPSNNDSSFEEIKGIFAKEFNDEEIDAVELIKQVRG